MMRPNPPALSLVNESSSSFPHPNPSFFSVSLTAPVRCSGMNSLTLFPRANKFSLYLQSVHGNLISSTLTALSSVLAGFFSSCSSSTWISNPFFLPFLKAHIQFAPIIFPSRNCQLLTSSRWSSMGNKCVNMEHSAQINCSAV